MKIVIALVILAAIGFGINQFAAPKLKVKQQEEEVAKAKLALAAHVEKENATLPKKVMHNARISKIEYGDNVLTYKYYVLGDPYAFMQNRSQLDAAATRLVCKGEGEDLVGSKQDIKAFTKLLSQLKTTSVFSFRINPSSGETMTFDIKVTPEKCASLA